MDMWRNKRLRALLWLVLGAPLAGAWGQAPNSCLDCHSALDAPLQVTAEQFSHDVHSQKGLNCASCHGGDPVKMDMDAMAKAAGFRGKIQRNQIPALCGHCHSDGAYMRQFNPSLRTDQLSQYVTSVHGKLLAKGDVKVAVCTDCHGVHDLRAPRNAQSKVYPLNIAQTCARCHANAAYMKGHAIPTDQFAKYSASVHHEALAVRGDLSAPTCTTCHGNHGAAPPGVGSVQNVCSTCHVFQNQMFEKSTHKAAFQAASLPGCIVCHNNHDISHPTDAKLGTGPQSVCSQCHTPGDDCDQETKEMLRGLTRLNGAIQEADRILGVAESSGMEVSEARLEEDQAHDSLTKARVTIHSFRKDLVEQDIQAGLKIAAKNVQAGKNALKERDYRRMGLGFSLVAIAVVVLGLWLYIRKTEQTA
jgi:hypothetical protein